MMRGYEAVYESVLARCGRSGTPRRDRAGSALKSVGGC
jgi:hypothetical protein